MKKSLFALLFVFLFRTTFSQSAATIANGNWTNPLIWNCTCIPSNGYSVTITNSVTLNTSLLFTSGGININNTGSLIQDASLNRDIWVNGGYFNNSGKANFRYFLVSAGLVTNPGSFTVSAFTNSVTFTNAGNITMDSMYVAGNLTNIAGAKIIGDSITNATGFTFQNSGNVNVSWSLNNGVFINNNFHSGYAFTNAGSYLNYDSLILTGSIWNKAVFYNTASGKVRLTKNFHNYHPSGTASFNNDGNVITLDSWYNTDTVKGPSSGYFSVTDTSANSGIMKGTFQFCDLTPPAFAPYIDFNSGSIAAGITYCAPAGIFENHLNEFKIYPNPSNGKLFLQSSDKNSDNLKLSIEDVNGKVVFEKIIVPNTEISEINLEQSSGIYFLKILNTQNGNLNVQKLIIQQ